MSGILCYILPVFQALQALRDQLPAESGGDTGAKAQACGHIAFHDYVPTQHGYRTLTDDEMTDVVRPSASNISHSGLGRC